ncbi:hypothetical protein PGTDC60_1733 [Porphyromonas gingivalis TDC60]|nr:hypothetical protein PGTDC60_1733 [Porphyromonas gingivalis TDC60]
MRIPINWRQFSKPDQSGLYRRGCTHRGCTLVPFRGEYIGAALLTTAATFSGRIHSGAIGYLSSKTS